MMRRVLMSAAFLLSAALGARADVIYTVNVHTTVPELNGTLSFEEPFPLTTPFSIGSPALGSSDPASGFYLDPTGTNCPNTSGSDESCAEVTYVDGSFATQFFLNPLTSIGTYGYPVGSNIGITIAAAPTPEPSTFALLGTGLLGTVGVLRRRFVRLR